MVNRLLEILASGLSESPSQIIVDYIRSKAKNIDNFDDLPEFLISRDTEYAEAFIRERLFENPDCIWTNFIAAAVDLFKNRTKSAYEHLEKICTQKPADPVAKYSLGYCCEHLDLPQKAVSCYKDALKFRPGWQLPLKRIAAIYFKQTRIEECIEQYQVLQKNNPDNITYHLITGYLYILENQWKKAKRTFEDAIICGPQQQIQADTPADFFLQAGETQQALDTINQEIEKTPSQPELLYKRAQIYKILKQTDAEIQDYQLALKICPFFIEAAIQLATVYSDSAEYTQASRLYYKALAVNTRYIELYTALACVNLHLSGKRTACETISLAGSLVPNNCILVKAALKNQLAAHCKLDGIEIQSEQRQDEYFSYAAAEIFSQTKPADFNPFAAYLHFLLNAPDNSSNTVNILYKAVKRGGFAPAADLLSVCLCEKKAYSKAFKYLPTGEKSGKLSPESLNRYYKTAILHSNQQLYALAKQHLKTRIASAVCEDTIDTYLSLAMFNLGLTSINSVLFRITDTAIENSLSKVPTR
jgi:tetratricopeptide (TPR) repeat protein